MDFIHREETRRLVLTVCPEGGMQWLHNRRTILEAPLQTHSGLRTRCVRPSRLRRSTQVVTESTAALLVSKSAGDGAATALNQRLL